MQHSNIIEARPKRRPRINRTREQWRTLIEKYRVTDLTHQAFCQQHQVTPSSLYKWRKIFSESSDLSPFVDITQKLASTEVDSVAANHATNEWQIELSLGQGMVLRINAGRS